MKPDIVFDGDRLRASLLRTGAAGGPLIVTFDFRKPGKTDFGAPSASKQFEKAGFSQLSIKSRANDWFINDETPALEARLRALAEEFGAVHMLGWSMGGYGAFRFAATMRAARIVAISPQVSLDPDVAPYEWRYGKEAAGFDPALGAITAPPTPGPSGLILADPFIPADLAHAHALVEQFPQVQILRLAGGGHPASRLLRESGKAWLIQRAARESRTDPQPLRQSHAAARRMSAGYWSRLASAAAARRPALAETARSHAGRLEQAARSGT
ncbi:alpha/beta hydrolase [Ponticoccus sp. SC2-23]|uniref:alpha/beta fold hydrolase n=1 Tax=Alexandriicola marinus TaxID=2081710 RepID=UPI000FD7281B|nr:alpha/beta hydrolase [Alexandriicola marinus]MBM1219888.1 alpha/beta hydrolase [Ponticoccus sp. SC6-9]MBM1224574.1 alpha/beta hydrolase [Ponticoccus sp. SC6-15]MBM1228087.1 alpha/beta hydrolase [Ponticoccus sp. SC6-38]MBM1234275.1 alpha/beta hydrolase [Ponticoccus sp. SC6-45]MBM1238589.1 alpha/beta hydrolase [Ponticoccus sp. SC6-49]MBM1242370.1 alpha/beta hydrolase [Ponticoccus sp. SC2-64]MBM1247799.1 alpha/beta hydrolase [Ponticoccus sp. SC6-42]MBM1251542.1 alpha/beta hydrolase [Pontico